MSSKFVQVLEKSSIQYVKPKVVRDSAIDAIFGDKSYGLGKSKEATDRFLNNLTIQYPAGGVAEYFEAVKSSHIKFAHVRKLAMAGLVATEKQLSFLYWADRAQDPLMPYMIAYVGAKGAGKSVIMLSYAALIAAQEYPNLSCLYIRKTERKANDQLYKLYNLIVWNTPTIKKNQYQLMFPNGSQISIMGYKDDNSSDNFQGESSDLICVEEAVQMKKTHLGDILAAKRSSNKYRPRFCTAFNPIGRSLKYCKEIFIQPTLDGVSPEKRDSHYIRARLDDNKFVDPDEYRKTLEKSYSGAKLEAYLNGSLTISMNQYFRFNENIHVKPNINHKSECPLETQFFAGLDIGTNHWNVFTLCAKFPDGTYHVLDQMKHRRATRLKIKEDFWNWIEDYGLTISDLMGIYSGHDVFFKNAGDFSSVSEMYAKDEFKQDGTMVKGIYLNRAIVKQGSRALHADLLTEMLGNPLAEEEEDIILPIWFVHAKCKDLITTLLEMEPDPNRLDVPAKMDWTADTDVADDFYDSMIYAVYTFHKAPTGEAFRLF